MLQLMSERGCHLVTAVSEFCTANVSLHPQVSMCGVGCRHDPLGD